MGRIPQNIVDQIYAAIDIVDIVSDYVTLKKKGANFWALSPFSNEKTPSFAVNPVKGIYKDFGASGKGGDAINFLMEMEGFEYVDALRHVARKYGIEIQEEDETVEEMQERNKRQSLFIVNEFACRFFQDQLMETDEGRNIGLSYFKERGILETTIEQFQLGYAPEAWDHFSKAAEEKQYKAEYLIDLGLASRSEKTGNLIDRFRGRVMFPILNPGGKVLGFGGRILSQRKDTGKYINSPESDIYHKSRVLYGLFQAKKAVRDQDLCILTEGYMDTIVLHQNGIRNVVASSGTALTLEQIRLIRRFTQNVLMIYDGDNAGIKAALRGIDLLVRENMNAKVLVLPDKHDPDSYVTEFGAQAFQDTIEHKSQSFLDFKMWAMQQDRDPNDPQVQSEMIKALAETVAYIPDLVRRQMYIKQVAQRVDITESLMTHAVREAQRVHQKVSAREKRREEQRIQPQAKADVKELKSFESLPLANQEKELLRVLINHHDKSFDETDDGPLEDEEGNSIQAPQIPLLEFFVTELQEISFENVQYEKLKQTLFKAFQETGQLNIQEYLKHPDDDIRKLVSDLLVQRHEISPSWKKHDAFVMDVDANMHKTVIGPLLHYKSKKIDRLLQESRDQIKAAQVDPENHDMDHWLEVNMHLIQMRKEIYKRLGTDGAISASDGRL